MGFLTPWFLAGLAAVGLPVWLHLLKRHRSTPVLFPSLLFFERRTQSSVKHRRLHYLLLFAVRTALVVLLVLAFANPFIRSRPAAAGGRKKIVAAIDNSFSMRQGGRLERARRGAAALTPAVVLAFHSRVEVADSAQSIEPTEAASSYAELIRSLRSMGGPLEVHLFSDMQKTSMPANFADLTLPEGVTLIPHPLASTRLPNFTVENVTVAGSRVQVVVAGYGTEAATRRISLVLNGKHQAAKTVEVPAGGRATAEFASIEPPYGANRGEARIDSGDAFPDDDRFYFPMERSDARHALFVHEGRDARAALYVATALDASPDSGVKLDAVTVEQAAGMPLSKYAFVVLSDLARLPGKLESELEGYVRGGGSVLITLGPAAAGLGRLPLLKRTLAASRYSPAETWSGVRFYHAVRVDAGEARVSARLSDSTPLLMEQPLGEGRVTVFASTFDNVSNDFPLHASFVPFIQQTAHRLAGLDRRPRTLHTGAFLEVGSGAQVLDPAGQRPISLADSAKAQTLRLDSTGFYDVRRPSGRHEVVAVNPDRRESDFDTVPQETLALWRNTGRSAASSRVAGEESRDERRSLGWYALAAAVALALAESFVANRHLPVNREMA